MFQHLNLDNTWPRLKRFGLEIDPTQGTLSLRKLPGPEVPLGILPGKPVSRPGASGMVAGTDGALYVSDPDNHKVYWKPKLTLPLEPLRCLSADKPGYGSGELNTPRGLAYQACRQRLLIADSGNKRIQVVDAREQRVIAIWGQTWPYDKPIDCGEQDGLDGPEQLACDRHENVYVIDRKGDNFGRVLKLDRDGCPVRLFNEKMARSLGIDAQMDPIHLALGQNPHADKQTTQCDCSCDCGHAIEEQCLYVLTLDCNQQAVANQYAYVLLVFDLQGRSLLSHPIELFKPESAESPPPSEPGPQFVFEGKKNSFVQTASSDKRSSAVSVVERCNIVLPMRQKINGVLQIEQKQRQDARRQKLRLQTPAFTILGDQAIVAQSPLLEKESNSTQTSPPTLWVYELGNAVLLKENDEIEASWLTLKDSTVVSLGIIHDSTGRQVVLSGGVGRDLLALREDGAYRSQGAFLAGPFTGERGCVTEWNRLRFDGVLPGNCYVQWFTLSRTDSANWSPPPSLRPDKLPRWYYKEEKLFETLGFDKNEENKRQVDESREFSPIQSLTQQPTIDQSTVLPGSWYAAPENQHDIFLRNSGGTNRSPADQLWIFGVMAGNEASSPSFQQARLEFNEDGWLQDLPEVYVRESRNRIITRSLLALLQSRFEDVSSEVGRLPALFSPTAMAARFGPFTEETNWLRRNMALPTMFTKGKQDTTRHRLAFTHGTQWLAQRGTSEGFRRLVWLATGMDVVIDEPGRFDFPDVIGMPDPSPGDDAASKASREFEGGTLGFTILSDPDQPGVHLPADLAHHFVVRAYEHDLNTPQARELLENTVQYYAPAHTTWSVQVIRPYARLGIQCRLGIDAVVATENPADPFTLNEPPGPDFQLNPQPLRPTVGAAHLGTNTPLI